MNKGELINVYAATANVKAGEAKTAVETFAEIFRMSLLKGEEVTIPGVGKLKVKVKPARAGRNPATGEAIDIPEKRVVKFTPSAQFEAEIEAVA
jgi:DNA-binding protein HU-beta